MIDQFKEERKISPLSVVKQDSEEDYDSSDESVDETKLQNDIDDPKVLDSFKSQSQRSQTTLGAMPGGIPKNQTAASIISQAQ